jgi:prepilin-type N-terminal cleavage/methylation domain-containing protein
MFHPSCKSRLHQPGRTARAGQRRGLTLLELLLAMSILVMIAGSLGALAGAVQSGAEFGESHGTAVQHARVTLERITRTVSEATASDLFPGILVVSETVGSWRFPDTLVVWHPRTTPRNPEGLPCFDELVVYCPDPENAHQLVEITLPENSDSRTVPAVTETDTWLAELEVLRRTKGVVLTDLLRTGVVSESNQSKPRGMVRFVERLRPSDAEWEDYRQGKRDWNELSWVLGVFGPQTGLRQAWVRIELQLVPTTATGGGNEHEAIPFLGSAALYYDLHAKAN